MKSFAKTISHSQVGSVIHLGLGIRLGFRNELDMGETWVQGDQMR
jgi:hypothetical protein